jgi:hypothetical protein
MISEWLPSQTFLLGAFRDGRTVLTRCTPHPAPPAPPARHLYTTRRCCTRTAPRLRNPGGWLARPPTELRVLQQDSFLQGGASASRDRVRPSPPTPQARQVSGPVSTGWNHKNHVVGRLLPNPGCARWVLAVGVRYVDWCASQVAFLLRGAPSTVHADRV